MAPLIVPHDPEWAEAFALEARALTAAIGETCVAIHHIGSTAITGIFAKPIIDMLGVVGDLEKLESASGRIEALGYAATGAFGIEGRRYFRKDNAEGQRTHHLHVYETGSPHIERHLAFRDFLRSHPEKAAGYSALKAQIIASGEPYQNTKDSYVMRVEAEALLWYRSVKSG